MEAFFMGILYSFKFRKTKRYRVLWEAPPPEYEAWGLCECPDTLKYPRIWLDPEMTKDPDLLWHVAIEELTHAYFFNKSEPVVKDFCKKLVILLKKLGWKQPSKRQLKRLYKHK